MTAEACGRMSWLPGFLAVALPAAARRCLRLRAGAGIALLLLAAAMALPSPAQAQDEPPGPREVPLDWALIPDELGPGDAFRLMFVTGTEISLTSADIDTYNLFVQGRAAAGNEAVRSYSTHFRALGSTATVAARDNTATNPNSDGVGEPIYWLGSGAKVADDYEDLYDESWDSQSWTTSAGGAGSDAMVFVVTGSKWYGAPKPGRAFGDPATGSDRVGGGVLNGAGGNPMYSVDPPGRLSGRLYALSSVFRVAPDTAGPGGLYVADATAAEGRTLSFVVTLDGGAPDTVTVDYATADGTATEGSDYRSVSGTLTFAPGETSKTVTVTVLDDDAEEEDETLRLTLDNVSASGRLSDAIATGTLLDADGRPTVSFDVDSAPAEHDGEPFTVRLAFNMQVRALRSRWMRETLVSATNGRVDEAVRLDRSSNIGWRLRVVPESAALATTLTIPDGFLLRDGRTLLKGDALTVPGALGAPRVAGVAQVGNVLEASFDRTPAGTVTWQWLRGGEEIAGAEASTYTPVAADVGARLSVRAARGGVSATGEATAPVWPAAANPALGEGEEELLSAVLTVGSYESGSRFAGYDSVGGRSFGAMDGTGFEDGGATYAVERFFVSPDCAFTLGTDTPLPHTAGLVAYWNGYRISGFAPAESRMLVGRTPQACAAYLRAMDAGSPDGVEVAVSLRRVRAAVRITGATVTSGPGDNGTWDASETVEAELRFSAPVTVTGGPPTLGVLLDGTRREAAYTGGSGTDRLTFAWTVTEAGAGAKQARVAANGLTLEGATLGAGANGTVETGFSAAPYVTAVELLADASGDGVWTPGERMEARLTFSEAVTVVGDRPWIELRIGGFSQPGILPWASGSGSATLVFSMVVPPGEEAVTGLAVVADSLSRGRATIVSASSGVAADLRHDGTEPAVAAATEEPRPLTAEFLDVPDSHGGAAFTFKLRFGEELSLSYVTLRDSVLQATDGSVSAVRRVTQGSDRAWYVTVTPDSGAGDVTVTLPARACPDTADAGAVCTADDRGLAAPVSATVPRTVAADTPFRVRLENLPDEHDGTGEIAFRVAFNKKPKLAYSYTKFRDSTFRISRGGTALTPGLRRLNAPRNDRWEVTVAPGGKEDLTVSIGPFAACSDTGAICTEDDEMLANEVSETILGPPGLSVADARVDENTGDPVDFTVTLGRASEETVTVDYATSDDTAVAGEDYTAMSGTLTFAPGETVHTVSVPVLPDGHDEGEETFTLTLSNAQGGNAWLKDATAVGTIENTDPMPQAWLARFGRTVADQVLEAVEGRFATSPTRGAAVSLAGQTVGGASANDTERQKERQLKALSGWLRGETSETRSRALGGRDLLTGTSFALTGGTAESGLVALWGRGAVSRFDGRDGDLTLDGEVASAMLGADWSRDSWTAGLLVSRSEGEGGYQGQGEGRVENALTGVFPYGRYMVNDRVTLWGAAGYGEGTLTLTPKTPDADEDGRAIEAGMDLAMGAVGVRGVVAGAGTQGGPEISIKSDAMAVRTASEKVAGLEAADADVTRLRLGLEGTWRGIDAGGGALAPRLELALRHDGGDAETGFGLDLGGGVSWSHRASGVAAEVRGRALLTHEADGFRDRGLSGSFSWDPRPGSDRGASLTLTQTVGDSTPGGLDTLLGREAPAGLAANDPGSGSGAGDLANRRLDLRFGYGFSDRFASTPELGLGLSNDHREYTLGGRLDLAGSGPNALELRLEANRREAVDPGSGSGADRDPEHGVGLRVTARW